MPPEPPPCIPERLSRLPSRAMSLLAATGRRLLAVRLDERDLRLQHYATLEVLAAEPGATQRHISACTGHDPSDVVALLDDLGARGLAVRAVDPTDRRRHLVSLTPEGEQVLAWCRQQAGAASDEFLGPLDADERARLEATLQRLLEAHRR